MALSPTLQQFVKAFQIESNPPASEDALRAAESRLGAPVPEPLRSYYLTSDGGKAGGAQSDVALLSMENVLAYGGVPGFFDGLAGYFPFLDNNDSNPVCVCCKPPLTGYVVLVSHDEGNRLMFRSVEDFLKAAMKSIKGDDFFDTEELPSAFDKSKRTKEDVAVAHELVEKATGTPSLDEEVRSDALRLAIDLFSKKNVAEIAELLKDEDAYVREHAADRLRRISGRRALKALGRVENDYAAFVDRFVQILQREGLQASVQQPYNVPAIRIDPWPIWPDMEFFYKQRRRPDIEEFFLERVRFFIEHREKENQ